MSTDTSSQAAREQVAKKIRFLLHNQSITIDKVASRLGVSKEYMREVLDAKARPTRSILQKVCNYFNVKMEYFGSGVHDLLWEDPQADGEDLEKLEAEIKAYAAQRGAAGDQRARPGLLPKQDASNDKRGDASKPKRKFDLAELAAHHQALLECLIEKKVISSELYAKKVEGVRKRAKLE